MDEKGRRVLVVTEHPDMANLIRVVLERRRNDEIMYAPDGNKGLTIAEEYHPDMIFIYLWTPCLNAFEFFKQARKISSLQNVPIIFFGARDPHKVYRQIQPMGVMGYVYQPFTLDDLVAARDTALRGETYYPPLKVNEEK